MESKIIQHEDIYIGSKFYGDSFELYEIINGVRTPVDLSSALLIKIDFEDRLGDIALSLSTEDNTLTIDYNKIIIPEMVFNISPGSYSTDIAINLPNEEPIRGIAKMRWNFINPITKMS
jgi:hypothetical protein